jgi:hypothetical protein
MARRPTAAHNLALRAAEAAAEPIEEEHGEPVEEPVASAEPAASTRARGRPKGRRPVKARFTVYLDEARHAALVRTAEARGGRSIHSLILEGIDHVTGKPVISVWK